jgi:hypothetical protein
MPGDEKFAVEGYDGKFLRWRIPDAETWSGEDMLLGLTKILQKGTSAEANCFGS